VPRVKGYRGLFIALLAVFWFAGGLASSTHAAFEAFAHSGDHLEAHEDGEDGPADAEEGDHDHPAGTVCGPCHAHALKSHSAAAPVAMARSTMVRPGTWLTPALDLTYGLFRPPRV